MSDRRASDADRERAAERLRRAGGDGRLTVDELDDRVRLAYEARTRGELGVLAATSRTAAPWLSAQARASSSAPARAASGGSWR